MCFLNPSRCDGNADEKGQMMVWPMNRWAVVARVLLALLASKTAFSQEAEEVLRQFAAAWDEDRVFPVEALRKLVAFTVAHHRENPDFVRMVMIENIHNAEYLDQSPEIRKLNKPAIERVDQIYQRGVASGDFRAGIDPLELHWQISAFSFFNVSNRATFSGIFGKSLSRPRGQKALKEQVVETILRFVLVPGLITDGAIGQDS